MIRLVLALVLVFSSSGCGVRSLQNGYFLTDPEKLVKERKYQEALAVYDRTAKESAGTDRGASALFSAAELRVWSDNPGRDYTASLQKFEEYLKLYPDHRKVREALNWRHMIRTVLELRKENEQLTKNIEQLKRVDIRHEERRTGK